MPYNSTEISAAIHFYIIDHYKFEELCQIYTYLSSYISQCGQLKMEIAHTYAVVWNLRYESNIQCLDALNWILCALMVMIIIFFYPTVTDGFTVLSFQTWPLHIYHLFSHHNLFFIFSPVSISVLILVSHIHMHIFKATYKKHVP